MPIKNQMSQEWISNATEPQLRDALRLMEALVPSEPKFAEITTKALFKELRRRQAPKPAEFIQLALTFS